MMLFNRRHKVGLLLVLAGSGLALIFDASAKQTLGLVLLGRACTWLLAALSLGTLRVMLCLLLVLIGFSLASVPVLKDWGSFRASLMDYDAAIAELRQGIAETPFNMPRSWTPDNLKGFMALNPHEQIQYLNDTDPEFRFLSSADQAGYVDYLKNLSSRSVSDPWDEAAAERARTLPAGFFDKSVTDQFAYLSRVDPDFAKATATDQQGYVDYLRKSSSRTVKIPESVQRWALNDGEWIDFIPEFPTKMTTDEIVQSIKTKELRPQPTFSLWGSITAHKGSFISGVVLVVLGLIGCAWIVKRKRLSAIGPVCSPV